MSELGRLKTIEAAIMCSLYNGASRHGRQDGENPWMARQRSKVAFSLDNRGEVINTQPQHLFAMVGKTASRSGHGRKPPLTKGFGAR